MPPGHAACVGQFATFEIPASKVVGSPSDKALGRALVEAWRRDGVFNIAMTVTQQQLIGNCKMASKQFFRKPMKEKEACVDPLSYSGYTASGKEITNGKADYVEIFTATKDLNLDDARVRAGWPCHGPCPWPDVGMREAVTRYMKQLSEIGEKLLVLIELGLNVPRESLTRYTKDGWHHLRTLR